MDIKIEGFTSNSSKYYQSALNLRSSILVDEMGFDKHLEFDGKDEKATQYILFCDMIPAGFARWVEDSEHKSITIDRLGIAKNFRGRGFALLLIKFVLQELIPSGKVIKALSSEESLSFFLNLGFEESKNIKIGNKKVKAMEYKKGSH